MSKLLETRNIGNNALQFSPEVRREERLTPKERQRLEQIRRINERERRRRAQAAAQRARQEKLLHVGAVAFVGIAFIMLVAVIAGYASVAAAGLELSNMKNTLKTVQAEVEDLRLEVTLATDLQTIQEKAAAMGMGYPDDAQILKMPDTSDPAQTNDTGATTWDALKGYLD